MHILVVEALLIAIYSRPRRARDRIRKRKEKKKKELVILSELSCLAYKLCIAGVSPPAPGDFHPIILAIIVGL